MNITLSKEGKKMNFKMFTKLFGEHFKTIEQAEAKYRELTGRKVGKSKKDNSEDKEV